MGQRVHALDFYIVGCVLRLQCLLSEVPITRATSHVPISDFMSIVVSSNFPLEPHCFALRRLDVVHRWLGVIFVTL